MRNMIFLIAVMKCCLKYYILIGFIFPPIEIAKLTIEAADKKYDDDKHFDRRLLHEKANAPPKDLFVTGIT